MGIIAVDIVFMFRYLGSPQVGTGETFFTRSLKGSNTWQTHEQQQALHVRTY